jgi:LuxR family maltose regulon positive regulatory protein
MPKSAFYTLTWSLSHQAYELSKGREDEILDLIPEDQAWLVWVSEISSFAFRGKHGFYTARKEQKLRGEGYWYAYARVEGKLTKRYLGRGQDLTLARLEQAAQELRRNSQDALLQTERAEACDLAKSIEELAALDNDSAAPSPSPQLLSHFVQLSGNGSGSRKIPTTASHLPAGPLLATKLRVPQPPSQLVQRPRLIQQLQQGVERPLILLSAPAGFGKSTLLAEWLSSQQLPAAWLSLEPQDNDPTRFLSYLIAALQSYDPHLGINAKALLHPLHAPPLENVLTALLNELSARRTHDQEHVVLVLDDYHVITERAIHAALALLLDHLPPHMHLVISSREDPPLPLARLRGRDEVLELRAVDFQFTPEETTTYLVQVMGLSLSTEQSALLQERTEGWITGLQLAAHSLQDHNDPAGFITAFSGSHRYVMDYLLEEVLSRQPAAVQDFLLQTCLLDRLCAPLADAVRAQNSSQVVLDFLEQTNLFIVALDDERQWYRYHRLFAQVLRQRLQQTASTLIPTLHQHASRWYEEHGLFVEAISHALLASAFEEAARLIEQYAGALLLEGQMQMLCDWLHALPDILILDRPSLCIIHAIALMYTNQLKAASARLQMVEQGLGPGDDNRQDMPEPVLLGQVVACWSLLARLTGDLEQSVRLAHRALELLPTTQEMLLTRILHAGAMFSATHAYLVNGDVTPDSERLLMTLIVDARAANNRLLVLKGLTLLARFQVLQGRLHQAAATYEEVMRVVRGPEELQALADNALYYFGLGDLLREWNTLEGAAAHLAQGMDMLRGILSIDADKVWLGYAALARLQQARGRYDQALATLDAFVQLARQRDIASVLITHAAAMRAHIELAQGNLQAALRWAATSGLSTTDPLNYLREREYLTLARIRIAQERITPKESCLSDVLGLLERLLADAEANGRMHSMLEVLVLCALARQVQGNSAAALAALGRALALAEPEGYVRLFLDEGQPMVALLRRAQKHGIAPVFITKLLTMGREPEVTGIHLPALAFNSLVEPLTARERAVLELMLNGASNREIARELIVSVNTVKKHILNICGKLNVHGRTQAIAKARKLHLL